MVIHVEDLKFKCIIGILNFERVKPQDVIINLMVDYDNTDGFINYADIVQIIKEIMIKSEFSLIEDALETINLKLTKEFNSINSVDLKITKPSILKGCKVSVSNFYKIKS